MNIRTMLAGVVVASMLALIPHAATATSSPTGTLVVVAVDSGGRPLAGLAVETYGEKAGSYRSGTTKADGTFTRSVPTGTYAVSASDPRDFLVPQRTVSNAAVRVRVRKGHTSRHSLTFFQPATIEGIVTRADGKRPRIDVSATWAESTEAAVGELTGTTSSTGAFSIDGLAPGSYTVGFAARDEVYLPSCFADTLPDLAAANEGRDPCRGATRVVVTEGAVTMLAQQRLTRRPGAVRGTLRHADGSRSQDAVFAFSGSAGRLLFRSEHRRGDEVVLTGVPPGRYKVKVTSYGANGTKVRRYAAWFGGSFSDDAVPVTVTAGGITRGLDVVARPTVSMKVTERSSSTHGVARVTVRVKSGAKAVGGRAALLIDGRRAVVRLRKGSATVRLTGLPPGEHVASVRYLGTATWAPTGKRIVVRVR